MNNNTNNGLNDEELLRLIKQELHYPNSPVYDQISDQYSSVSDEEDIIIRDPASEITDESSKSQQFEKKQAKWKYCCQKCTKSDKGSLKPKTCVCIVPASQRRIQIGEQGCLSCHCTGCSIEDEKKKQKKIKKKRKSSSVSSSDESSEFKTVNGCCKKCMKAFSKMGKEAKSCLCQVPRAVRKKPLPAHGCQYCGCHGCNPEDKKKEKVKKNSRQLSPVSNEANEQNLNNFQNAPLIQWLNAQNLNPGILGIGIPQRTYSYIYGKEQGR
ncbi:unnamed protein product (macronuclear) [Paramecium tetraurelia]|uniref:Uncharacterized protein n=1 Tax=Paramecium tetraurelia TaxID=5888 RepID=A0DPC2_PARTE|nr:uncharacterized protein GSPATT00019071001 [Paramecium tetraurelia]CAK84889.1 unnamed protein product [Paramecium tetraurelia]|eukprot:XP_001452286.1 hypothetical protein (macronuclear) [Paramecium tetraurelia strain d4-2]